MNDRATRAVVFPTALALFAALGVAMGERSLGVAIPVALGVAFVGAFAGRRDLTEWPLAVTLTAAVAGIVVLGSVASSSLVWMGFCVVAAWVAFTSRPVVAVVFAVLLHVILLGEWLFDLEEPGWAAWSAGTVFSVVVSAFAQRLRQTVADLNEAQEELAERTRAQERDRIAAEMHDVIGHALTVSLLHISGARLALDEEPDEARRALDEAETLTRRSLEEVRATVGLMRSDAPTEMTPLPAATELPDLVESFRRAGSHVTLQLTGDLARVGSARGLAVYRIVQEALTNATKHAHTQPVRVSVDVSGASTRVEVTNPLSAAVGVEPVEGSGMRGMRERAHGVGGSCIAGPVSDGWRVEAELPT